MKLAQVISSLNDRTLYLRIANAIEICIEDSTFKPGDVLPTQRQLADVIKWPLSTVTRGYREAVNRKLIQTSRRKGSYVLDKRIINKEIATRAFIKIKEDPSLFDLTSQSLISPIFAEAVAESLIKLSNSPDFVFSSLCYKSNQLNSEERTIFAKFFSEHYELDINSNNIVITSGVQNALISILLTIFSPGDNVGCEKFTYKGLRYAAKLAKINLVPIDMDELGILPRDFSEKIENSQLKGLVCVPNYQNPTAVSMPENRRQDIAQIAKKHGIYIVEDDVYGLLSENGIKSIYYFYPESTFLLNGFSKSLGPGLRVSAIVCSEKYQLTLSTAVRGTTWMPSQIDLFSIVEIITNGKIKLIIKQNKELIKKRTDIFSKIFSFFKISFGLYCPHAIIFLPQGMKSHALIEWLQTERVFIESSENFSLDTSNENFIRLNLTGVYEHDFLCQALKRVATAISADVEML